MNRDAFSRILASLIALCVVSQAALADVSQSSVWAERHQAKSSTENPLLAALPAGLPDLGHSAIQSTPVARGVSIPPSSPLYGALAALPNDQLTVVDVVPGSGQNAPIVLIQDVHLNAEAQMNIAAALSRLSKEANVSGVYLEGGFGPLDFNRLRAIPTDIRAALSEDMVRHGRMGGPSLAAMTMEKPPSFVGADEEKPFQENADVVVEAAAARVASDAAIMVLGRRLTEEKRKNYGPAMASYDRLLDGYRTGSVSLGDFVSRLDAAGMPSDAEIRRFLEAYRYEKSLDLPKVENERRTVLEKLAAKLTDAEVSGLIANSVAYRDGRIGFSAYHERIESLCAQHAIDLSHTPAFRRYLDYVALADKIDVNRLVASIDGGQKRLIEKISKSAAERELAEKDTRQFLAGRLVRFELTPSEWHAWNGLKPGSPDAEWSKVNLPLFERFYQLADRRSHILAEAVLKSSSKAPAVLVAGGFHTEGLVRALAASGRPVIVTAPRITSAPDSATRYLDAFTREKTPLDRLFSGERLTLNPPGQVLGGSTGAGLSRTREILARAAALTGGLSLPPGVSAQPAGENVWETHVDAVTALVATGSHGKDLNDLDESPVAGTTVVTRPARAGYAFQWVPGTPGSWALFWAPVLSIVRRLFGPTWAERMRPVIGGLGEGAIVGALAMATASNASLAIGVLGAWVVFNAIMHYVFGIYRYNRATQQWEIRTFISRATGKENIPGIRIFGLFFALPGRQYLRANFVSSTSLLAFSTAAVGGGLILTIIVATVPHILANFTRERRIAQQRFRATEEKKLKFAENMGINKTLGDSALPDDAHLGAIKDALEGGNDLASFTRFAASGLKDFRLVMLMQPGSTNDKNEGSGFKAFNDTIGQDLMNRVWRYRNEYTWRRAKELFGPAEARAGREILVRVAGNYKSFRFAVNMEALKAAYPTSDERETALEGLLNGLADDVRTHMLTYMTVKSDQNESLGNGDIVGAVLQAQDAGKLPKSIKAVPMYWGMSTEPENQHAGVPLSVEEVLTLDAQTVNAINTVRAQPLDGRGLGGTFNFEAARATVREIASDRAFLMREGRQVITLKEIPGRDPEFRLPQDLVEVYRKKADKVPAMLKNKFPDASDDEIVQINVRLASYISKLLSFDTVKPWVGTKEKPMSTNLAAQFNLALTKIGEMEREVSAPRKQELWNEIRELAREALSKDVRMPSLGSTFEFYGNVPTDQNREDEAIVFIDFRGFGALIVNELEATAERLASADRVGAAEFRTRFETEMNTLGDRSLDVFSESLLKVSSTLALAASGNPIRFYFGGDDVSAILPRNLVYGEDGVPRADLINKIFSSIAPWMRIRVNIGSTAPYRQRQDPVLETSLALTSMDEIVSDSKAAEEGWIISGKQVSEVVTYSDRQGSRYRMPVNDRKVGKPELVHTGHDDQVTFLAKRLMGLYRRWFNPSASATEARNWAESKAEESMILLGALVAAVELPLIPFIPMLFLSPAGIIGGILLGSTVIVLFHEGAYLMSFARERISRVLGKPANRAPISTSWVDHFWARATARFVISAMILSLAFMPIMGTVAAGTFDPWVFNWGRAPVFLVAWAAHAFWNSFAPPSWRLSLFRFRSAAQGATEHSTEDAEAAAAKQTLYADRNPNTARQRLIDLASSLPLNLGVANALKQPSWSNISSGLSSRIDRWTNVGAMSPADAARFGRAAGADLREAITGQRDLGPTSLPLEMSSEAALFEQMGREKEAQETPADLFGYRFIAAGKTEDAVRDAGAAVATTARLGAGHTVLVVDGDAEFAAVQGMLRASGKEGLVQLVRWSADLTMRDLQQQTAAWLANAGLMTRQNADQTIASANFRLVLPDPQTFNLPAGFLNGVSDLSRYRVFLVVQAVLLAVEIRPDSLENAQALAALVAKQA